MKASPAVRSLRAVVFAVLCVLLAAGGHVLATGTAPPLGAQVAGFVPVFAAGWLLGGRERILFGIEGGTLAAQGGLHHAFGGVRQHATHTATVMHGMRMVHLHALVSHPAAARIAAAVLLTWWLRRGEAALWSLLRWAVAFVPGLAAWWQVQGGTRTVPGVPRSVRRSGGGREALRQVFLRHSVHRRGPPLSITYAT
ncbi:hypothetical protein [Streptomyces swartbergensis]|uniref:hypothetical protein n=1 Tax=Streptomyces swartbergensis TaxID=487165 RepID=UPI00382B8242